MVVQFVELRLYPKQVQYVSVSDSSHREFAVIPKHQETFLVGETRRNGTLDLVLWYEFGPESVLGASLISRQVMRERRCNASANDALALSSLRLLTLNPS